MKKIYREVQDNKGITVMILVVTIVVLLILAGITIGTLTSDNGVIKEATTAKEKAEKAGVEEQIEMAVIKAEQKYRNPTLDNVIEEIKNNGIISDTSQVDRETGAVTSDLGYVIEGKLDDYIKFEAGMIAKKNETYTKNGTAIIPTGFAIVPDLDDVSQGLVISDVANDTENIGNQFVWIPVTNKSQYARNMKYEFAAISAKAIDDTDYLPEGINIPEGKTEVQVEEEIVRKAGGFYIARYETGKEGTDTLVSKKGATVWVSIGQEKAKAKAETFINNSDVKSALISGVQWDITMAFINGKTDGTGNEYDVSTYSSNRHTEVEATTGQNEADKVCNIYDLEGNYNEYVAEQNNYFSGSNNYIYRGGNWNNKSVASYRYLATYAGTSSITFRLVLYVM